MNRISARFDLKPPLAQGSARPLSGTPAARWTGNDNLDPADNRHSTR